MALSSEDAARLVRLRARREQIIGGDRVSKVSSGGRSIEKSDPDLAKLDGDIAALEAASLTPSGRVRQRGAIGFRFAG